MPKNFNLQGLVQEHDTFTDVDGSVHEFRNQADMGIIEMSRAQGLQKLFPQLLEKMQKNPADTATAQRIDAGVNEMLGLLVPTLSAERIAEMTVGQKQALLDFWSQAQGARRTAQLGEVTAGQTRS